MEGNEEMNKLRNEVEILKGYLNPIKVKETEQNHQKEMLDLLINSGGELLLKIKEKEAENNSEQIKLEFDLEKSRLKSIELLDKREKNFKTILLSLCILSLVFSVAFLPNSEIIVPVISLIIGLLFKSNSFSEYLKFSSKNRHEYNDQDN